MRRWTHENLWQAAGAAYAPKSNATMVRSDPSVVEREEDEMVEQMSARMKAAERLREFIRKHAPGQCKMLSLGEACECPLCSLDFLLSTKSVKPPDVSVEEWPVAHVLHLLRNPYGHTEDELRAVRLYAADLIERLGNRQDDRIATLERERDALGAAIRDAAVKIGICRDDVALTGPQLIMLCEDLAARAGGHSPQGAPEPLDAVGGDSAKISFPVSRR